MGIFALVILFSFFFLKKDNILQLRSVLIWWTLTWPAVNLNLWCIVKQILSSSSTETSECFICRDVELQASDPLRKFCDCKNLLAHHVCLSTWIQRVRNTFHTGSFDILNLNLGLFFPSSETCSNVKREKVYINEINVFVMLAFLIETKRRRLSQGNELTLE